MAVVILRGFALVLTDLSNEAFALKNTELSSKITVIERCLDDLADKMQSPLEFMSAATKERLGLPVK